MRTYGRTFQPRRRGREARALAAFGLVCGLAAFAASVGCGGDPRVAASPSSKRVSEASVVRRTALRSAPPVSPQRAQPTRSVAAPAVVTGVRDARVQGGARLYGASSRWLALMQPGGSLGGERIVLTASGRGRPRAVLDGAVGRREGLAVTGMRVSDSWLVWEEASQYDLELGPIARWRLYAAPISGSGPALGTPRVVDSGVVGTRPRCDFALSGSRLAIASTRSSGTVASGRGSGSRGRVVAVASARRSHADIANVAIVDLATGTRRAVLEEPGSADAVSWDRDRIVVTLTGRSRARRATAVVLDDSGALLGRVTLATGLAFAGPARALGDLVVAAVAPPGSPGGDLFVFSSSGACLWNGGVVLGGPVWAGERIAYLTRGPSGSPDVPSLTVLDPITGIERVVDTSVGGDGTARVAVLPAGCGAGDDGLVFGLEPAEPSVSGSDTTIVRTCLLR